MDPLMAFIVAGSLGVATAPVSVPGLIIIGGIVIIAMAVTIGVLVYEEYQKYKWHKADMAQQKVELDRRQTQLASQVAVITQETKTAEDAKQAAITIQRNAEQILHRAEEIKASATRELIKAAIEKINVAREYIEQLKEDGVPPEKIKQRIKKSRANNRSLFSNSYLEDDLRDFKTNEILNDPVLAPDGCYYNRSTLTEIYEQALKEGKTPVCYKKDASSSEEAKALPNPTGLVTDQVLQAKIKILQKTSLAAKFGLPSTTNSTPINERCVFVHPTNVDGNIYEVSAPEAPTFLRAPAGYCAFFIPNEMLTSPSADTSTANEPAEATVAALIENQAVDSEYVMVAR